MVMFNTIDCKPSQCPLAWCWSCGNWGDEWNIVVFSDKSCICLGADDWLICIWLQPGRSDSASVCDWFAAHQPGIRVWNTIRHDTRSPLVYIMETLAVPRFVKKVLQPIVLQYRGGMQQLVFQHDNAYVLSFSLSGQCLQHIQVLPWQRQYLNY